MASTFDEVLLARNTSSFWITNDKDDDKQLRQCWRIQDCGHCVASKHNCGWCPYVRPIFTIHEIHTYKFP
ncbi:hypothetical protein Vi05172_g5652 [Venturia inaequalis]|nr:hypothetical protein Vi05172_g5652 [Venturia inaequalis]